MKKILPILLSFLILYTLPLAVNSAPVGVLYEQGSVYDGGQIYFIYVNIKEGDTIKDSFYLSLFKGNYFSALPLSQLKADLNDQWVSHADKNNIPANTLLYSKHLSYPESAVIDESFSISQSVIYAVANLFNMPNIKITSTAYLDNRTVLSPNIANEDNHAQYDKNTNTLILNYTYDITEKIVYVSQSGTTNEYLQKTYNSVQFKTVCMLVELDSTAIYTPTPTPSPTSTPTPAPTSTPTPTPTPMPTVSTSPIATPQPSPSHSAIPTATDTPSSPPSPKPSQTVTVPDTPSREQKKYDDIWTYVILQSLIILIILIIILSTRRRKR